MTPTTIVRKVLSPIAFLIVLLIAAPAFAAGIEIAVGAPSTVAVGDEVTVKAVVTEAGVPVEGANVALTYQATLSGESARVEITKATSDESGIALLVYEQRADENGEMQVVYIGPETDAVAPYSFTIAVDPNGEQLYQAGSGLQIPFVNGTLVIIVISTVWFLIASAAVYLVRVGLAGRSPRPSRADELAEDGSIWIGVLLASVVVITALGMVIVFVRAPVSNTHVTDPGSYERTIVNYVGVSLPYEGFGLADEESANTGDPIVDGGLLYFKFACAACHGLRGQGAVVGDALAGEIGSLGSFTEDVREGPKGMPAYDSDTLSDENIEKIHAYIKSQG